MVKRKVLLVLLVIAGGMVGPLYTKLGRPLTVQEYLDRQDFFSIIFVLSDDLNELLQIQVNSWKVREFNHLKI